MNGCFVKYKTIIRVQMMFNCEDKLRSMGLSGVGTAQKWPKF